jgi:glutathione S-transferase
VERPVDLYSFRFKIRKETGVSVMPVVVTPEGEWLQDSSEIIERMEARFPARPVVPSSPVLRFASYLMELWGDEFWIPTAMHTRWSYPENYPLFEREAGRNLLPGFPRALQNRAAGLAANEMRKHLPSVGVVPSQFDVLERWTRRMLDALDAHFTEHKYLFGDAPTIGDFGLVGPMYGHLGRDPWPKAELVDRRFHLRAWIDRMAEPPRREPGAFYEGDHVPESLAPVYRAIFAELTPLLEGTAAELRAFRDRYPEAARVPRGLGDVEIPLAEGGYKRSALPYMLWMAQRALDVFNGMSARDRNLVRAWAKGLGGERLLALEAPRVKRAGLSVAFAS